MKIMSVFPAARAIIKARLFGMRTPLAVTWQLTTRCNLKCEYCGVWEQKIPELSTSEITSRPETLHKLGALYISFSGGEPSLAK